MAHQPCNVVNDFSVKRVDRLSLMFFTWNPSFLLSLSESLLSLSLSIYYHWPIVIFIVEVQAVQAAMRSLLLYCTAFILVPSGGADFIGRKDGTCPAGYFKV